MVLGFNGEDTRVDERLMRVLAQQLKTPLLQIARQAELAQTAHGVGSYQSIRYTADMALRLVDSYLLSIENGDLLTLQLEPVSVSATLQDTAHILSPLAKHYGCELEVHLGGKYGPVMAHRQSLEFAISTLAQVFIESTPEQTRKHHVILGAHKSKSGLVAGIFGNQEGIHADMLRRGRALFGTAEQGLPGLSSAAGAGVFVADALLSGMDAPLHISRHNTLAGLAATLVPSQQLQLV